MFGYTYLCVVQPYPRVIHVQGPGPQRGYISVSLSARVTELLGCKFQASSLDFGSEYGEKSALSVHAHVILFVIVCCARRSQWPGLGGCLSIDYGHTMGKW